ncbi:glycosyl transferase [Clostridium sp. SHJSY1]|uniref:macrolide family glycosyltransferase n=1 Tax=Clostridium sp. SHJSY1 TaxID=2942483 RepID=UPI002876384E|nr:macrolide family glycosyltransferase [Clostridium sp. SHJSY1]MDS0524273.1 glycosyl transferase [Clostridium sp. SHJSY1]
MSKVLFLNMFGHAHINPTIGLVKELINRGEKVTYFASEEFQEKIEKTGATFRGHRNLSTVITGNFNLENNEMPFEVIGLLKEIKEILEEITDTVLNSEEKFDYIIYDSLFILGNELGRVLKIPAIRSGPGFASNERINLFLSIFNKISPKFQELLNSSECIDFIKDLQKKYGINFPTSISTVFTETDMTIVYTSKYFQICGESFDNRYKFIGPSISDRNEKMNFSLEKNDKKKVIYISLGTVFDGSVKFYESCFKAFADMDANIILSVGKKIDITIFRDIPSNFIVRNYVPQLEVLKQTDVFITHGGMNSTNEGLYYYIPLILIPQSVDQPFVANRVAELGAGIVIEKAKVTPEILRQSVVRIFSDNTFRINSKKIGKSLREAGGHKKGVDEILNLITNIRKN